MDWTPYIPGLIFAFSFMGLNLLSPGPNILSVIGTAMTSGRKPAAALAMGVATGSFFWALFTTAGLTALIAAYGQVMIAIKIAGAAYLLWLSYKAFRSASRRQDAEPEGMEGSSLATFYWRGVVVIMTNPKAAFAWIALVSLSIGGDAPLPVATALVLGCTAMSVAGHLAYAVGFSTTPVVRSYLRARRFIQFGLGTFFAFASYKLATSKV